MRRLDATFDVIKHLRFKAFLEFGCDTGYLTQKLSSICGSVTAVDINKAAIDYAKKTKTCPNVHWKAADFTTLHVAKNSFDGISFVECLYYFDDPVRHDLLKLAFAGLMPGGYLLFGAPIKLPKKKWEYDESRYFDSPKDMVNLIKKHRFKIVDTRVVLALPGWIRRVRNYVILAQK